MTLRRRRLFAWSFLAVFVAIGAWWLARLDYGARISTDVLDLIPGAERDPDLALVRELASKAEARTMLILLRDQHGADVPAEVAKAFANEVARSPAFKEVVALADGNWRDPLGRELFALRFPLLFPGWLREFSGGADRSAFPLPSKLAAEAAGRLKAFTAAPEAIAFQDLVPADPLLLVPRAIGQLRTGLDVLQGGSSAGRGGLVWAQIAASPLSEAGQGPAFAAIEGAAASVRTRHAGLQVSFTGVNRFAAASRARIEREVASLNTLSLVVVLAVAVIFIRRVHRALHLVPVIAGAVLGAWVATTMAFDRVHVIVFVLGALLTGVAIDYGFYLYMQPPLRPGEEYGEKVRRLAPPLFASCFTTVTGFALLLFSELPMIRQLGVFVGVGLLCALVVAVAYFATVRDCYLEPRAWRRDGESGSPLRRRLRLVVAACWVAALPGLARISWRDDVRELEVPAPEIRTEDARIRAAFGQREDRATYLTTGATLTDARLALHRLDAWLSEQRVAFGNLGPVIPTAADFDHAVRFARVHPEFGREVLQALEHEGFESKEFWPFVEAYAAFAGPMAPDLQSSVGRLQERLAGPLALLLHTGPGLNWFVTLTASAAGDSPPADARSVPASQLQSLNRLFARYRQSAVRLSLAGLAIVGAGVLLTYGWRNGTRIFAIPCGACLGIFGGFGWLGQPLNLFHLLGAFLGVCLTHNYSIFTAASAFRHERPPVSVRLSALTTAASFGVLALSGIPVVRALGVTVMSMVLVALLFIELEHLSSLGQGSAAVAHEH